MIPTTLLIKNVVCHRCVMGVENILQTESNAFYMVIFGEIHLWDELTNDQKSRLLQNLDKIGFEMIDNQTSGLI